MFPCAEVTCPTLKNFNVAMFSIAFSLLFLSLPFCFSLTLNFCFIRRRVHVRPLSKTTLKNASLVVREKADYTSPDYTVLFLDQL